MAKNFVKEGETQTDPEIPPKLAYAAVISQNIPPSTLPKGNKSDPPSAPPPESRTNPPKQETSKKPSPIPSLKPIPKERTLPQSGRAIVAHGIAVTKKLGKVRDWMETATTSAVTTANPWMGKIVAARWLVKKERREGKKASSVVIYLEGEVESDSQTPAKYDSCLYDWDRNSKVDRKGKRRDVEEMDLTT
ncbi:hypothetical protein BDZ91DRAFT_733230 [Kalaharituber pfeilii]|nr:hypothetical protein BDZ91DRAFT_733230 [Kalaharituber pfeilii]